MKVALVQMTSGRDVDENLRRAYSLIKEAASHEAKLVVLPEMFACLGVSNQKQLAEQRFHNDDVLGTLSDWAESLNLYLIAGSVPLSPTESSLQSKVHAACLVFNPKGQCIQQYNKLHLFDVDVADNKGSYRESDTFLSGDQPAMTDINGHSVGLSICYDLRFPELYQFYMASGCRLITVPSAFTYETGRQHWEVLLRARAIETQSFVLAANQTGVHEDGRRTWGHSMVVSPTGEVIAQLQEENGVLVADLDMVLVDSCRSAMPLQQHKRNRYH